MVLLVNKKARLKYKHAKCILRSIGNLCTFTPSKNVLIVIMNIPCSLSEPRKTISLSHNTLIVITNVPRSIGQPRKTILFSHKVEMI